MTLQTGVLQGRLRVQLDFFVARLNQVHDQMTPIAHAPVAEPLVAVLAQTLHHCLFVVAPAVGAVLHRQR